MRLGARLSSAERFFCLSNKETSAWRVRHADAADIVCDRTASGRIWRDVQQQRKSTPGRCFRRERSAIHWRARMLHGRVVDPALLLCLSCLLLPTSQRCMAVHPETWCLVRSPKRTASNDERPHSRPLWSLESKQQGPNPSSIGDMVIRGAVCGATLATRTCYCLVRVHAASSESQGDSGRTTD